MSFDTTSTHDSAIATTNGGAVSAPGKRTRTSGLSAPQRQQPQQTRQGSPSSSPTSLHGTGWLAGVLGFGSGDSSGGEREDHETKHAKHKDKHEHEHKKKKHHHHEAEHDDEPITGGGEGVAQQEAGVAEKGDDSGEAGESTGRPAPPGVGPEGGSKKAAQLTIKHVTAHAAPDGGSRERTTVAVGEKVRFTASKTGTWSASDGPIKHAGGRSFTWEAMDRPGTATITLRNGNQHAAATFKVVAPSQLHMVKFKEDTWSKGTQGAGMWTNVTIGPSSVSFGNVEWLEVPGGPSNISGYFTSQKQLNHHPNPNWLGWNSNNTGLNDHASLYEWPKPWSKGSFTWVIPNKYRVNGKGSGEVFIHTHQVFHMLDSKGTTVITKGGAEVRRTP